MNVAVRVDSKQSEVGEIPEAWSCLTIQQLIDNGSIVGHLDGNHGELYPRSHEFKNFGVPYIGANNFYSGQVDLQGCKFLSEERASLFKKGVAQNGDILFAHNATVGPVAKLKTSLQYVILSTTATYFRVNGALLNNDYLLHYMKSDFFSSQYRTVMAQSTRNQVPITAQRKLAVVIPPIEEQRGIAASLSDVDELINSLDQLIAKKRDIQKAAMQQLLTGQRRLPGFSGEWQVKRLGDLVSRMANGSVYTSDEKNGFPITRIETISEGSINWGRVGYAKLTPEMEPYKIQCGDILYSHINSIDHIGKVARYSGCNLLYHGMNLILLRPTPSVDGNFLFILLSSEPVRRISRILAKQAVSQASINTTELRALELKIPEVGEQTAIATILSDMETELAALESRRDKARQLKQGMMQELLTGRIRLTNSSL